MKQREYLLIPISVFPPDIIEYYNIKNKVNNKGLVLAEVVKGMYGLPQAGCLAYGQLVMHLQHAGYVKSGSTPGLFKYVSKPIQFILVVDDFGIKYQSEDDLNHLLDHLGK